MAYISWLIFLIFLHHQIEISDSTSFYSDEYHYVNKRALQKTHEKTISEKRMAIFFESQSSSTREETLVTLLNKISREYLSGCTTVILYDKFTQNSNSLILEQLFKSYPLTFVHGQISDEYQLVVKSFITDMNTCVNFILFLKDVMRGRELIGEQAFNKVVMVARSSQWRVYEFLGNKVSHSFVNLLVIAQAAKILSIGEEASYILFGHELYTDALGSSTHKVLTSWINGTLTRPNVSLFSQNVIHKFSGHRFLVSLAHQPPFVVKRGLDENDDIIWDGTEVRLMKMLSELYNFTIEFKEASNEMSMGSADAVTHVVKSNQAHLGIAGLYTTTDRLDSNDISVPHTQDCASFVSLASTALPRYRAIMGPFHWTVWLALVLIYLLAIFPITFSDKHTLKPLLRNPEEIENMFWYVFGTFTNAFSFAGKRSWSKSNKFSTRLFIGFYWLFTIIITACYTGSIIAFVTLPVFPFTVDTSQQLLDGRYQIGTLDRGGWQYWFDNSSDPITKKLLRRVDYVTTVEEGLRNTTKAFFWNYAFLGSRAQLDYIIRTNFTTRSKRSLLHISDECFVPFGVSIVYPKNAIYVRLIDKGILKIMQGGFMKKFHNDFNWLVMRSATGKLLSASGGNSLQSLTVEDRALTLDDTQGMFLLLGIGFLMGGASLLSEWFGGCFKLCKREKRSRRSSLESNPRSYDAPTPRQKIDSVQYASSVFNHLRLKKIDDENSWNSDHAMNNVDDMSPSKERNSVTVHSQNGKTESINYDEEIDKIFDFAHIFGEETAAKYKSEASKETIDNIDVKCKMA